MARACPLTPARCRREKRSKEHGDDLDLPSRKKVRPTPTLAGGPGGPANPNSRDAPLQRGALTSVLNLESDGLYRPKTRETREAYEALLSTIQGLFGDQPNDVLRGAADEVLSVLKNEALKDLDKKKEIEKLLNPMASERFAQLVAIGKLITDFSSEVEAAAGQALDDEIGVAVEFDEDSEDGDSELDEVEVRGPPHPITHLPSPPLGSQGRGSCGAGRERAMLCFCVAAGVRRQGLRCPSSASGRGAVNSAPRKGLADSGARVERGRGSCSGRGPTRSALLMGAVRAGR